ncbi:hypothetical protein ACFQYP_02140 [Nonomuraea antimicrobica]
MSSSYPRPRMSSTTLSSRDQVLLPGRRSTAHQTMSWKLGPPE